jgi:tryptophan-rich sensory protein
MNNIFKLIISLIIPQLAGGIGGIFTAKSVRTWYKTLKRGAVSPPDWVFGPVWTTLFLLMGISLYLVWTKENVEGKKLAIWIFGIQLSLNVIWSLLFFGLHRPDLALIEIFVLWLVILVNFFVFFAISKPAGLLLVPYLAWVSFAIYLNYSIWRLN